MDGKRECLVRARTDQSGNLLNRAHLLFVVSSTCSFLRCRLPLLSSSYAPRLGGCISHRVHVLRSERVPRHYLRSQYAFQLIGKPSHREIGMRTSEQRRARFGCCMRLANVLSCAVRVCLHLYMAECPLAFPDTTPQ